MTTIISAELMNRLIASKMLFIHGIETLEKGMPFNAGFAVLNFQDSVEIYLRVIAEYIGADVKPTSNFHQLIESVKKIQHLTHTSELNKINGTRVQYKHAVLEPRIDDVKKFRFDLESFYQTSTPSIFGLNYAELSLVALIQHPRTENHLRKAEEFLDAGDYENALIESAISFGIYQKYHNNINDINTDHPADVSGANEITDDVISHYAYVVSDVLMEHELLLGLMSNGINIVEYKKFKLNTPDVNFTMSGEYKVNKTYWDVNASSTYENALFSFNFVVNSILQYKKNFIAPRVNYVIDYKEYELLEDTEILLLFSEDKYEVIRVGQKGEILRIFANARESQHKDYVKIFQDNEFAFVKKIHVKLIND